MTTFGFELEVSGGAENTLAHLIDAGLTGHEYLHPYHCECNECDPRRYTGSGYAFKAQEDCTADGEFISHILTYGTEAADKAIIGLSKALILGGAETSGNVGNHVHIFAGDMTDHAKLALCRLFARYEGEIEEIAEAGHPYLRDYNGTGPTFSDRVWGEQRERFYPYDYMRGHKLAWKNPTVEFRLWNSTRMAWRIRTHVGISHAMAEAAKAGVSVTASDNRCLEEVIGDYIDGPTWAGILRQRFAKGGLAERSAA